jgi:hypothetical protein
MGRFALFMLLVLASFSFAVTRSECYADAEGEAAALHSHNAAQDPSGSIATKTTGCSGTCANTYSNCIAQAQSAASSCKPDANGYYTACFRTENSAWIACANNEIDCCLGDAKRSCDATYPADDTSSTPTNPEKENECYRDYGPYALYDARTNACTCPPDSTFLNKQIHQCVLNTVYAYCDERNAAYDAATDSCICYEGYIPGDGTCVLSDEAGSGGGSLGAPAGGGAAGSRSGTSSGSGCGSAAILLMLAGLAPFFQKSSCGSARDGQGI